MTPRAHLDNSAPPPLCAVNLPVTLSAALHVLRREIHVMAERGEPWQHAIDRLRAHTPDLWRRLSDEQRARFLRHLRPWWDVHRHRAAPQVAQRLAALQASGRLKVLAGEIVSAVQDGPRVHLQHRGRGSLVRHRFEAAGVVNCTGGTLDPWLSKEPLARQLFDEDHARAHPSALGFDVDDHGRVIAASGAPQPNLYALGPITQGALWECIAVPEIRVRAAVIAMMLAPER